VTIVGRILEILAREDRRCFLRLIFSDVEDPIELDYASLLREAARWVEFYKEADVPQLGRVVIVLPHSADLYAAFLGALLSHRVPAVLAPPSPKLTASEFEIMAHRLFANLEAEVIVADGKIAKTVAAIAHRPVLSPLHMVLNPAPTNLLIEDRGDADEIAFIQYSSGTTGTKKGTIISHQAIISQVDSYSRAIELGERDSIVSWLPLYHDMGMVACFLLPLLTGTPVTVMSPFEWIARPRMLLDAVHRYLPTLMWLPNFAYHVLARAASAGAVAWDLSSVRAVINCSEPIRHASHVALTDALAPFRLRRDALKTCYAMAEATFAVTSGGFGLPLLEVNVDPDHLGPGSVICLGTHPLISSGRPLPETTVLIGTPDSPLPENQIGEIWIETPSLFGGYLGEPEATDAVLRHGLLRTGDIGFLRQGELFVLGRADDMIVIAGRNFQPHDIEAAIDRIEGVVPGRTVAFGVHLPSEGTSQLVVMSESEVSDDASRTHLAEQIRRVIGVCMDVVPRDVRIVEPRWLKKSTSGKLSRAANRVAYLERFGLPGQRQVTSPAAVGEGRRDNIRRIVLGVLGGDREVTDDDPLLTSSLIDSLGLLQLCISLEERFGSGVPSPNLVGFAHFDSIASIDALIADFQAGNRFGVRESSVSTRLHKCRNFERGDLNQDLFIFGSSTAHLARTKIATDFGYRAFNFSVSSGDAVDFYCLLRFALDRLRLPLRRLVVCTDVFLLKSRNEILLNERLLEVPDLLTYLMPVERAALPEESVDRLRLLANQKLIFRRLIEWTPRFAHGFDPRNGDLINLDRSLADQDLPYRLENLTQRHADMEATFNGYDHLSPKLVSYYEAMSRLAMERNIAVDHVILPFHEVLAAHVVNQTCYPARMEELLTMLTAVGQGRQAIHDFRTVERFGGIVDDFTDPAHPGPSNLSLVLRRVLASSG
jgi:fatty-acyl-CoA synthase